MMGLEEPPVRPPARSPGWMLTLADLLSLLLAFFVLLFAATSVSKHNWQKIAPPLAAYLSGRPPPPTPPSSQTSPVAARDQLTYVGVLLDRLAQADAGMNGVKIVREAHLIRLILPDAPGTAADPQRFAGLAPLLGHLDNQVDVVVHLAPAAGTARQWRQAVLEALKIATALRRQGDFQPVTAMSMAATAPGGSVPDTEIIIHDRATAGSADSGHAG
jgi:chemotaxis protein MotB